MDIVLATHNKHKVEEIRSFVGDMPITWMTLEDFPHVGDIEETGETLLENSLLKARTVHTITGLPAIADDTGLEVDALDGAPGVHSARWAGEDAAFEDNINKLLHEMKDVQPSDRTARFRSVISLVNGSDESWVEGSAEGVITEHPQGAGGFGYDPVFFLTEKSKTFAELSLKDKNKISHRGAALKKLRLLLDNRLAGQPENREDVSL
ncbi:MAG: RdgB/HAM1 family non-canonical purine NTP pyrophosphatase [Candidatus Marinimicrobia bacterium]|nr:RdgB/HAM1 family non-canonical purine NTP pyrophosphatase [Candidatus Neomarinimicrobiota bacterium]